MTSENSLPEIVTATSLGPWPGTDPVEAAKVSLGLFTSAHLPSLIELPDRGVGSDAVGRTAALLVELPVDVQPYGWRFVDRAGHDYRRAVSALSTDVNVLADVVGSTEVCPAELKVQVLGPVSLAAAIHLHYGERALRDYGARRDIAQSLAAGLVLHAQKVQAAVPGAALTLQVDEPDVAPALAGTIPTASGYRTLRSIPSSELRQTWTEIIAAAREAGFSQVAINLGTSGSNASGSNASGSNATGSNATGTNFAGATASGHTATATQTAERAAWSKALEIALDCGIDAIAVPLSNLHTGEWEHLAGAIESGMRVWAGTVPVSAGQVPASYAALVERIMRPWRGLGLADAQLNQLRITPEKGLARLTPQEARAVLNRTLDVAEELTSIRYH